MANTTGGDKLFSTPWTTDRVLRLPAAIPATSTIFYPSQAMMRDINGNLIQCDDTQKGEFVGVTLDFVRTQVDPVDTVQVNGLVGDKMFDLTQPLLITALIAAAAAGDEGRKVYWLFNNQVSYSPGNSGNYAGRVWLVKDSTHVVFTPPWVNTVFEPSEVKCSLAPTVTSGTITLLKWDANKMFELAPTAALTIVLPPIAKVSAGDQIYFLKTNTTVAQITLQGSGTDNIQGANTSTLMGTGQWARIILMSDGTQWVQVG